MYERERVSASNRMSVGVRKLSESLWQERRKVGGREEGGHEVELV